MTTIQVAQRRVKRQQKPRAPADSAWRCRSRVVPHATVATKGLRPAACGRAAIGRCRSDGPVHGEAWVGAVASGCYVGEPHPADPPEIKGGGMQLRTF